MGLVHIYTGNGKGKTTAAIGLATRFLGMGGTVIIVQFLKGRPSGEIAYLERDEKVSVFRLSKDFGFTFSMDMETKKIVKKEHERNIEKALEAQKKVEKEKCLLIFDECAGAISSNLLEIDVIMKIIQNAKDKFELVLTGRDFSKEILEQADYISEVQAIRHPMDQGVEAREGIEY